jgi:hypothetical protein
VNFHLHKQVKEIKKWFESVKRSDRKYGSEKQEVDGIRAKYKGMNHEDQIIFTQVEMTEEEQECRQWVLDNQILHYKLEEDMNCPQQPSGS